MYKVIFFIKKNSYLQVDFDSIGDNYKQFCYFQQQKPNLKILTRLELFNDSNSIIELGKLNLQDNDILPFFQSLNSFNHLTTIKTLDLNENLIS